MDALGHDPHSDQLPANPAKHLERYQWQKGQSGNPGGRPKGRTLMGVLRELLDETELSRGDGTKLELPDGKQVIDLVAEAFVWKCVKKGDPSLLIELLKRLDGPVRDKLELDGKIIIDVRYADDDPANPAAASPGAAGDPPGDEAV